MELKKLLNRKKWSHFFTSNFSNIVYIISKQLPIRYSMNFSDYTNEGLQDKET